MADRLEPYARLSDASGLGPATASSESVLKTYSALKLVTASAAMAFASAAAGFLAVVALGAVFGTTIGTELEFKTWAAVALGQLLLGAMTLWRAPKRFGPGWRAAMGFRVAFDRALARRIAWALAIYWCWAVLVFLLASSFGALRPSELIPQQGPGLAMFALTVVVIAPICEEAFFRGYVQGRAQEFLSPGSSIVLPSALFALAHFRGDLAQPAVVFMLGVLAGWLRRESGSLLPAMALHAVSNLCVIVLLTLAR